MGCQLFVRVMLGCEIIDILKSDLKLNSGVCKFGYQYAGLRAVDKWKFVIGVFVLVRTPVCVWVRLSPLPAL